jgi:aspartate racemase
MSAPVVGLIGGLGVGAAVHYYRELASAHDDARDPLRLVMTHASISRTTAYAAAGDRQALAEYLSGFLTHMAAAGATLGVVPAVTPHIGIKKLKALAPIPVSDLIEAVADHVRMRRFSRIALFGTRYVVESDLYGGLHDVEVVRPRDDEVSFIHHAYSHLAHTATVSADHRNQLIALADTLVKRDAVEAVVLAGTDFCLMFNASNTPFPHVDCARVHIEAITHAAASTGGD